MKSGTIRPRERGRHERIAALRLGAQSSRRRGLGEIPARTEISDALSADLKRRGFKFVGSTIMYAFMQAVGMVNDHETRCFRYRVLAK